jgi:hypothetical protein
VEYLLGRPPDKDCPPEMSESRPREDDYDNMTHLVRDPSLSSLPEEGDLWASEDGGVVVEFDSRQRVVSKAWLIAENGKWSFQRSVHRLRKWWRNLGKKPAEPKPLRSHPPDSE